MSSGHPTSRISDSTSPARPPTARAARTRSAILLAAETEFADKGFEATRLEDIAAAVGIRRASIVYYFKDKRALYDAVLGAIVEPLERAIARGLATELPAGDPATGEAAASTSVGARIENAVAVWVDFLAARPTFARLLLREIAAAPRSGEPTPLAAHLGGIDAAARELLSDLRESDDEFPDAIEPSHFASAIAGATVFYAAALASLAPGIEASQIVKFHEEHRAEVVRIARRLLGDARPRAGGNPL